MLSQTESQRTDYYPLYQEWCATLKIELKEKSKVNVDQRLCKIIDIANRMICHKLPVQQRRQCFSISSQDKLQIICEIESKIDSWPGVNIPGCKEKIKKDFTSYQSTARNWFNRNKAKIYGNHLFYGLIFRHILKWCYGLTNVSDRDKMITFIDIFEGIMYDHVQFPRTKLQPLLPHQTLMQPNRFKTACERFTLYYNQKWILSTKKSSDRDRAKKVHGSFMSCLTQIKSELIKFKSNTHTSSLLYPFHIDTINSNNANNTNNANMNMLCIGDGMQRLSSIQSLHEPTPCYDEQCYPSTLPPIVYPPNITHHSSYINSNNNNNNNYNNNQSYQASRMSSCDYCNVSQRRYSPIPSPIPSPIVATPTDAYTPFVSSYPFNNGDSFDNYPYPYPFPYPFHQNQFDNYNYDDDGDSFVFTNLSHNLRSPTPLFDGFL